MVLGEPYQHDRKALELVLRFLGRKNEMVCREYWLESSSASPPKSAWVKEEKKADMRLIIEPKENDSLCCEKETTKENFFPKPPQTYDLL